MKKIKQIILMTMVLSFTLIHFPQSLSAADTIRVVIENELISSNDAVPYLDANSRTYVPIRVISENLGAKVDYNKEHKAFHIKGVHAVNRSIVEIVGIEGKSTVEVNGVTKQIDPNNKNVTVVIKNGRTFVPLRFFSDALGYTVDYRNRVVYITTPGNPIIELPVIEPVPEEKDKYENGMDRKDFIDNIPNKIPAMTNSKGGNQAYLGTNGSNIIVKETNRYDEVNKEFLFEIIINGWNIPGRSHMPPVVEKNKKTMTTTKQIISLYTSEHEKVYNALDSYISSDDDFKTITTKDGRTFKFDYGDSGVIVRIK